MNKKMNTKNLMVFLMVIASILLVTTNVAATDLASTLDVKINDIDVAANPALIAGDTVTVKVFFTSDVNDTNVRLKVELEGEKLDSKVVSGVFDVEAGKSYVKTVQIEVPYELKDAISEDITLNVELDGADYEVEKEYTLTVQRPSFNVGFLSMNTPQTIKAGDRISVEVILRNIGYNDLEDLRISVRIPALSVEESVFVGDLVSVEYDDEEDTLVAKVYLEVPYGAKAGLYALEVEAYNEEFLMTGEKQISVENEFESNVVALESRKTFAIGEKVAYEVLVVNPTNSIKLYRVVANSDSLFVRNTETVIAIPAGESKVVEISVEADSEGEHQTVVSVFSEDQLTGSAVLSAGVKGGAANVVIVLTVVLAIILVVLLTVLIVLLKKKPEKEEFGESYY
jgi:hypothetical protein